MAPHVNGIEQFSFTFKEGYLFLFFFYESKITPKILQRPGLGVHTYHPRTQEAEVGRWIVRDQPGLDVKFENSL